MPLLFYRPATPHNAHARLRVDHRKTITVGFKAPLSELKNILI